VPLLATVGHGFVDVVRVSVVVLGIATEVGRKVLANLLAECIEALLRSPDFVAAYWLLAHISPGRESVCEPIEDGPFAVDDPVDTFRERFFVVLLFLLAHSVPFAWTHV